MKGLKQRVLEISTSHPKKVMAFYGAVTLVMLAFFPLVKVDTDPENMLSHKEPVRIAHEEMKRDFSLYDTIVVGIVDDVAGTVFLPATLERVAAITDEILKIDGVVAKDLISPTTTDDIEGAGGLLTIEPLMSRSVPDAAAAARVRERALANPILKDLLVSGDGTSLALFVPIKEKKLSYKISKQIEEIIDATTAAAGGGTEDYLIAGLPVAEDTFGVEMFKQMAVAAPLAGLLIYLLMVYFFRRPLLVVSAMIVAVMTVIWTMGLLIGTGFTLHIMSSMIPIFLMPIAVVDSIHILSEFHDRFSGSAGRREALGEVMDELFTPMAYTSLTSAVGFASLMMTPIPPVQVFGAFVAFGIVAAWALTITFIPAFIMLLPEKSLSGFGRDDGESGGGYGTRLQRAFGAFVTRRSWTVVTVSAIVLAASVYGITLTVVNDNPVRWFSPSHPIRVADTVINDRFGGTYGAYLVVDAGEEGAFKDPARLAYIEGLRARIDEIAVVGKTTTITDVVRKISFELHDGDPAFDKIPDTAKKVAQYLFLYEMSGDPEDLYHLVTDDYSKVNIWVQLKSGDNKDMGGVVRSVDRYLAANPLPAGSTVTWAGLTYLNVVWQDKMVAGMLKALAGGAVAVFIIMTILFRSPLWGAVSMVPLTLTITCIYGLVGYVGKDYDMPIAVLSALTLGVSIDFAIHLSQRARQISKDAVDWDEAVSLLFDEPVRAILRNMVVISVGFMPLLLSPLVPYKTVGVFFATIMAVSGAATLLVLPALMKIMKGRLGLGSGLGSGHGSGLSSGEGG